MKGSIKERRVRWIAVNLARDSADQKRLLEIVGLPAETSLGWFTDGNLKHADIELVVQVTNQIQIVSQL